MKTQLRGKTKSVVSHRKRNGAASLDYVLTLGALFTISGIVVTASRSIMKLVYENTCFFLAWPFM